MHAQLVVDHIQRAIAHPASSDRMENRGADLACRFVQLFFALQVWPGQVFAWAERRQGRGLDDLAGDANGLGGNAQIFRIAQVVGIDQR
ncbi:hypothetical protein D3C79_884180 [compost metagenome]